MIGQGEFHSMAYDKVQESIDNVLYDTTEENVINLIKDIGRYSNQLSQRDLEKIAKSAIKTWERDQL